jgi:uncharacterized lipoprotein YmbA
VNGHFRRVSIACLMSVGVGCSSAPIRYYTLTPPLAKTSPPSEKSLAIDVRVVHIPPQLNRAGLMLRTGPAQVVLLENERWASPVRDEIKDALGVELQRRLPTSGFDPAYTKLTLDIDVQEFEAELGQYALLQASWTATLSVSGRRSPDARAITCIFRADETIGPGYAAVVEAYQRETAALADAIAAVLAIPARGIGAPPQTLTECH